MTIFEKNPGPDWFVYYRWDDEPETEVMSVFGVVSPYEALREAEFSLGEGYEIVGLMRDDFDGKALDTTPMVKDDRQ